MVLVASKLKCHSHAIERWWQRTWDQFSLVSRPAPADATIEGRLTSQTESSRLAGGLMFRESLARDSRFVMLGRHPSGELFLTWRDGPEDEGPHKSLGNWELPVWMRLHRHGNAFTAFRSRDGQNWDNPVGEHVARHCRKV